MMKLVMIKILRLFVLLFLLQLQLLLPQQVNSYDPVDNIAVNCGSKENVVFRKRSWVGDVDTKIKPFSLIEPQNGHQSLPAHLPYLSPSVDHIPFGFARLSTSEFIYSFPVTGGPWFLRLHFYPTSYANFTPNNSFFSVKVGNFTLLKDFNPLLWVVNDDIETLSREFCISAEAAGKGLSVTFLPSTTHSDAYAFINGIEVVSMPSFLYYTDPNESDPTKFKLVDPDSPYQINNDSVLETLYRVDCGESQVPPGDDTGMFRNWENDAPYVKEQHPQSISAAWGFHLNYKNNTVANYTAPEQVYLTARNYGMNETANYNVTWEFEVDSEFIYMVRLHFCEFELPITHYGNRAFQIFIADYLAEESADVIGWSGDRLVPTHRDYAVDMRTNNGPSKKLNLTIKLQRLGSKETNYRDVILNGIEIFKISDDNNNLAGPNPQRNLSSPQQILQTPPSKSSKTIPVIVAGVAVSGLVLASLIGIIIFRRRRRAHDMEENSWKTKTEGSTLPSHLCRYFTIAEIRAATNNFDEVFIIGVGGFGNVYKGYIDGATPVAIKRLKQGSQQGADEFLNEIEMLSQLRHHNLVSLIGYCNDGAEMILVYDFMQRGTLREYLYGSDNRPLPWKQRLQILLGAARGLHYLHAGAKHNIIHRDVKSTNILLDEKWVAKVSDFGLSKVGPTGMSTTHVSTIVKGSLGYLDPEYYKRQRLTLKSDVYSFGVVLLEVLCGRSPLVRTLEKEKVSLVDWVRRCYDRGDINHTVDPFLKDSLSSECLKCYCQVALNCLLDDGNQRPSMSDVVGALEFAMQLVESEEDNKLKLGGTKEEEKCEEGPLLLLPQFMSDEGSDVRFTTTETDESCSKYSQVTTLSASTEEQTLVLATVFSEIGDPRAR
ncbi:hypothetical protein VNO77_21380 [Canavalia gladiata]|uniref:Protein kinase domain-containing protein n=1 Tax=Canavalia gladiata TaxID=3824 RepID=A0AAN9QK84_CANGL